MNISIACTCSCHVHINLDQRRNIQCTVHIHMLPFPLSTAYPIRHEHAVLCAALWWRGVAWCGVVWCGMMWCCMVWCGVMHLLLMAHHPAVCAPCVCLCRLTLLISTVSIASCRNRSRRCTFSCSREATPAEPCLEPCSRPNMWERREREREETRRG